MENLLLSTTEIVHARNHSQQLKVMMNLPVRLVSENQVLDVLPIEPDPSLMPVKRIRKNYGPYFVNPSADTLIDFFHSCKKGDLLYPEEVCKIYQITKKTLRLWKLAGLVKSYRISTNLVFYKTYELPSLEVVYGSSLS